jgi:V-type H+-transporting ATPase subunit H
VAKKAFKWGPVHSEKFWQENCFHFHEKENLDLIKILVKMVEPNNDVDDRSKAIACFDLGEFARFFSFGRQILEQLNLKESIIMLMGMKTSTAELKKEAITCY